MTDSPAPFVARAASWPLEFVLAAGYAVLFGGCAVAALAVPASHGEVRVGLVAWCAATAFLAAAAAGSGIAWLALTSCRGSRPPARPARP